MSEPQGAGKKAWWEERGLTGRKRGPIPVQPSGEKPPRDGSPGID